MRINTDQSIKIGERIHSRFGSWDAMRKAAEVVNGVFVVPADEKREREKSTSTAA